MSNGSVVGERCAKALMEYSESANPTTFQVKFATPSPTIAERAKCFRSVRTSSIAEEVNYLSKRATEKTTTMETPKEPEPLCPANIVATRRVLFSPVKSTSTNAKARPIWHHGQCRDKIESPTANKENARGGKIKKSSDNQSVKLREVVKSYSFSDVLVEKKKESAHEDKAAYGKIKRSNDNQFVKLREVVKSYSFSDVLIEKKKESAHEDKAAHGKGDDQEDEPKGLVEKRTMWLQGRVLKSSSFTEPDETSAILQSEESSMQNIVAARTLWLQKQVSINSMPNWLQKQVSINSMSNEEKSHRERTMISYALPRFDDMCTVDNKKNSTPRLTEVKQRKKAGKKKINKAKTLVETRAQWLQHQVCKNELFQDIPSDDEEEEDGEKPKTDIQLRLEALQRDMMSGQQPAAGGVAPKRSLAELP